MKCFAALLVLVSFQVSAAPLESFDLLLTGKTAEGPHPNDDIFVRKMIATFVENLNVKKYVLRATPANGGFRVCLTPADQNGYNAILGELNRISIRSSVC